MISTPTPRPKQVEDYFNQISGRLICSKCKAPITGDYSFGEGVNYGNEGYLWSLVIGHACEEKGFQFKLKFTYDFNDPRTMREQYESQL